MEFESPAFRGVMMGWRSNAEPPRGPNPLEAYLLVSTPEARAKLANDLAKPGVVPTKVQQYALELIWSGKADKASQVSKDIIKLPIVSPLVM
jgi:hypothetical protein